MNGYHVTKAQADAYVSQHSELKLLAMEYRDRHGQYPKEADHGVWDVDMQCWVWVETNEFDGPEYEFKLPGEE